MTTDPFFDRHVHLEDYVVLIHYCTGIGDVTVTKWNFKIGLVQQVKNAGQEKTVVDYSSFTNVLGLLPVDVIPNEREVKSQAEKFSSDEKEQVEEGVHDILRQNQWVQTVALVDRIFVVCLQLIEGYYLQVNAIKCL